MISPTVSVIIPSYNYAEHISACIDSVLAQTYTDFDLIVVDDGSKDNTAEVVQKFTDPRVRYIYQDNKGLPGARNTGIKASSSKYLAFLDSDDKYHPEKLSEHIRYLDDNPDIGLSYCSRLTVSSADEPLVLRVAPSHANLRDLVLYYPFAPSDVVMHRSWAEKVDLFDESFVLNSEDLNFHIRLALAGCKFGGIQKALTYRQIHTDRIFKNLSGKMETYIRALDTAFNHPDCPTDILSLRDEAYGHHYLIWGWQAAIQNETDLAHRFLNEAIRLKPELNIDNGQPIIDFFISNSVRDGGDHELKLRRAFQNFPSTLQHLAARVDEAIGQADIIQGTIHTMWDRNSRAKLNFKKAAENNVQLTERYLTLLSTYTANLEAEFGSSAAQTFVDRMLVHLDQLADGTIMRKFKAKIFINRAFAAYDYQKYTQARSNAFKAMMSDPSYIANRGALSVLFNSLLPVGGSKQS